MEISEDMQLVHFDFNRLVPSECGAYFELNESVDDSAESYKQVYILLTPTGRLTNKLLTYQNNKIIQQVQGGLSSYHFLQCNPVF